LLGSREQKYVLYATGELLLVVFGILIALQVNNWNEERIEQRQVRQYAIALLSDLKRDIAMLEPITKQMQRRLEQVEALNNYTRGKTLDQINNLDLWVLAPSSAYRPYQWNRSAIEQLRSAGALREIQNVELVEKITAYDALTRHLDEDYEQDTLRITAAIEFRDLVIDSNYPADEHLTSIQDEASEHAPEAQLSIWQESFHGERLQLLTDNVNDVKVMVNKYDKLGTLTARVEGEIPRLIQLAEDLTELLADEYAIDDSNGP
jgi:hypothetical protein